jgi:hypothetical protein
VAPDETVLAEKDGASKNAGKGGFIYPKHWNQKVHSLVLDAMAKVEAVSAQVNMVVDTGKRAEEAALVLQTELKLPQFVDSRRVLLKRSKVGNSGISWTSALGTEGKLLTAPRELFLFNDYLISRSQVKTLGAKKTHVLPLSTLIVVDQEFLIDFQDTEGG